MLLNCAKALVFICGMFCGWMGPLVIDICQVQHVTMSDVGAMVAASSVGNMMTNMSGKKFIDILGSKWTLFCSAICIMLGAITVSAGNGLAILWIGSFLFGMGGGLNSIASTVVTLETEKKNPHAALNALNLFFGLGALAGPSVAGLSHASAWSYRLAYTFAAVYSAVLAIIITQTKKPETVDLSEAPPPPSSAIFKSPEIWTYALIIMFYVGVENGSWTWLNVYLQKAVKLSYEQGLYSVTLLWVGLCIGRALGHRLNLKFAPHKITFVAITLVLCSLLALMTIPNLGMGSMALCCLLGLAFGPIFPNTLGSANSRFSSSAALVSSVVISAGAVGGAFFPYLTGSFIDKFGLHAGIGLLSGCSAMMLVSFIISRKLAISADASSKAQLLQKPGEEFEPVQRA
ncbi:MAG: MFS transporter [Cyanobacteria bacterium TGS_CYA1]|nr:MFS transporter [Cyanobacteria bacterium TGS_CYA1]